MKKIIIWLVIALLIVAGVVVFVKVNYKPLDKGMDDLEKQNVFTEEYEEGTLEYAIMQDDTKTNCKIQINEFNSFNDKEQIIIQGAMLVYSDNVYVFFNENSKDDMEKATGIKSKFFRNIKDGESLYVGIKDGEVNVLITSDEVLFVNEYNPELKYVELSNDGATLFDVRKDNGKTILVY